MRKLTTLYVCGSEELVDDTVKKLQNKHQQIPVYDNGVLIRRETKQDTYIELVALNKLEDIVMQQSGNIILKGIKPDKVSDFTGLAKYIVIVKEKGIINDLRILSNKKMIEVSYR